MKDVITNIDYSEVLSVIWTVVLLPILTYVVNQVKDYLHAKKIDKYTDILYKNVLAAVKDVYETTVKDIKGTDAWTDDMKNEVKEMAKVKAIHALTTTAYTVLKTANDDFEEYLDGLVGTALYDLKKK